MIGSSCLFVEGGDGSAKVPFTVAFRFIVEKCVEHPTGLWVANMRKSFGPDFVPGLVPASTLDGPPGIALVPMHDASRGEARWLFDFPIRKFLKAYRFMSL